MIAGIASTACRSKCHSVINYTATIPQLAQAALSVADWDGRLGFTQILAWAKVVKAE